MRRSQAFWPSAPVMRADRSFIPEKMNSLSFIDDRGLRLRRPTNRRFSHNPVGTSEQLAAEFCTSMFRALYCLHNPFLTDCDPSSEQCKTNPDIPALRQRRLCSETWAIMPTINKIIMLPKLDTQRSIFHHQGSRIHNL